jgi:hypothetical protein
MERQGPVVRLGDALHDRQAEPDARVIAAYPIGTAPERLDHRRRRENQSIVDPTCDGIPTSIVTDSVQLLTVVPLAVS